MSFNLLWPHILTKLGISKDTIKDINTKINKLEEYCQENGIKITDVEAEVHTNKRELEALYNQLLNQVEIIKKEIDKKQDKLKPLGAMKVDKTTNEIYIDGRLDTALKKLPDALTRLEAVENKLQNIEQNIIALTDKFSNYYTKEQMDNYSIAPKFREVYIGTNTQQNINIYGYSTNEMIVKFNSEKSTILSNEKRITQKDGNEWKFGG